jgi:uncharacterized protein YcfJ
MNNGQPLPPGAVPQGTGRRSTALLVGGGLALVAIGAMATALVLHSPAPAVNADMSPPVSTATTTAGSSNGSRAEPVKPVHSNVVRAEPRVTPVAAVCSVCGVVESVSAIENKGEGTGIGAVAGGVLGAVVGHQAGGGNGKKALTVLGAVGGGLAGNEIEKRSRSTTVYRHRVRMADGSTRSVTLDHEVAVGANVRVENNQLLPYSG